MPGRRRPKSHHRFTSSSSRSISTVDGSKQATRQSTGFDRSIQRSPLHPNYHARVVNKGSRVSSPSWERKGSAEGSHGVAPTIPGRSQSGPTTHGDENLDHGGPAVPRFGDWDEIHPASDEVYTTVLNKVREERNNAGSVPLTPTASLLGPNRGGRKENSKGCCFCFQWGRK